MNGYHIWLMMRIVVALMGGLIIWFAANREYGGILDLIIAGLGIYTLIKCMVELIRKHEGTFITTFDSDRIDEVDFSCDKEFYLPGYGKLIVPGGFASKDSHIKVYWKRGMNPRVLTANEWFNY